MSLAMIPPILMNLSMPPKPSLAECAATPN
jgi:hypothetical protein